MFLAKGNGLIVDETRQSTHVTSSGAFSPDELSKLVTHEADEMAHLQASVLGYFDRKFRAAL